HFVPLLLLAATVVTHAVFAVSLGIFLSVSCRTTLRAYIAWIVVMIALLAGGILLGEFINERAGNVMGISSEQLGALVKNLNPIAAWLALMNDAMRTRSQTPGLTAPGSLFGIQVYLLAAAVLWLLANRRFRREGERG